MPLPTSDDETEYDTDLATGRRVELRLASDCLITLQYFPDWDNISLSFYTKTMPGFTIGMPTEDWPAIQDMIAKFSWRGKRQ